LPLTTSNRTCPYARPANNANRVKQGYGSPAFRHPHQIKNRQATRQIFARENAVKGVSDIAKIVSKHPWHIKKHHFWYIFMQNISTIDTAMHIRKNG
jgi:hypothetical protein